MNRQRWIGCWVGFAGLAGFANAGMDTGDFSYQGQIKQNGVPVSDLCDFEFSLWRDAVSILPEDQVGDTLLFDGVGGNSPSVDILNGLFNVVLDFGPTAFTDDPRWLQTSVRCPAGTGNYTTLNPRELITGAPYAIRTRGIAVSENGLVGIGTETPQRDLHVAGSILAAAEGFDAFVELRSDESRDATTMRLTSLNSVGLAVTDDGRRNRLVVSSTGEVGIGPTQPEALLHVRGAGRFRGEHVAYFESQGGARADGIAIQLANPNTNRENNYITFYNGRSVVTGRIEGFDLENGDWVPPPAFADVGLTFDPNISYNPNWLNPGTLPTASFAAGTLPTATLNPGTLPNASLAPGTLPSLSFNAGTLPTATFSAGTLPSATFNDGTLPTFSATTTTLLNISVMTGFSWTAGSSPSLSFEDGSLPSLTFGAGTLPTASLNPGTLPSLSFNAGTLPLLAFTPGTLPSLTFNGGSLPFIVQPPITIGEPSLVLDLPTLEEMESLFCWALEYGVRDYVALDPVSIAVENLKQAVAMRCMDEGVTYGSKGADYAEYLPKLNPEDRFQLGQIVGVRGGKVSFATEGAEQIMAVSRAPVVVGNVPPADQEDNYVTVGFMGQLPVVVRGRARAGDYVVPSGKEDGTAVAVAPRDLQLKHLGRTLGRAWSDSDNDIYSLINVVIGLPGAEARVILERHELRQAELASENARLTEQVDSMRAEIRGLAATMIAWEERVAAEAGCIQATATTTASTR